MITRRCAWLVCVAQAAVAQPLSRVTGAEVWEAGLVSGRFHILCGRFDWDLPVCCVFLS
jgi:hypothetical protein